MTPIGLPPDTHRTTAGWPRGRVFERAVVVGGVTGVVEEANFTYEGGRLTGGRLIDRGVTGIVAGSDLIALGAVRAAQDRGLKVPQDISVVGFDDTIVTGFTDPPLTSVRQPVPAIATAAVQGLLDQLQGRARPQAGELLFEPELIVRDSTAPVSLATGAGVDELW